MPGETISPSCKISDFHFMYNAHCLRHVTFSALAREKNKKWDLYFIDQNSLSLKHHQVSIKRFYVPNKLNYWDLGVSGSIPEDSDIAILEINEETEEIPIVSLNYNSEIEAGEVIYMTCFGVNELSQTKSSSELNKPRYGEQLVSKIEEGMLRVKSLEEFPNQLITGDSGCGIYNSKGEIVAIHVNTAIVSTDFFLFSVDTDRYEGSLLLMPYLDWIKDVFEGNEVGYVINLSQRKYVLEH